MSRKTRDLTRRLVALSMFAALAYACTFFLHIKVMFLTFDAKDAIMAVAGMFFGPGAAAILSLLVPTLELITIGSETGLYGFLMNVASSMTFTVVAALIYKYRKTLGGALMGLGCAVMSTTAVMLVMNLLVTPHFMGQTIDAVIALIPKLLLPFNLIKAVLNAALVLVLYKPVATALRRTRLALGAEPTKSVYRFDRKTVLMLVLGVSLIILSVIIFVVVLGGEFLLWE